MNYINDPDKTPYITYSDMVAQAVKSGIAPQKAYLYLASVGVRGELYRIKKQDGYGYGRPVKLAVRDNELITDASVCGHCGGLVMAVT